MATLDDLTTPLTYQQAKDRLYAAIDANGVDVASWKASAPIRATVNGMAYMLAAITSLISFVTKSGFLSKATTGYLEILAEDVYDTEAVVAQAATAEMTLDNSAGGGVFSFDPGDMIVANPTTGKEFTNSASISLGAGGVETAQPFIAIETGSDSNSAIGTVTEIISPVMVGTVVTNTTAFLGIDNEPADALRVRAKESLGAASPNGPPDAYNFIAKAARRVADDSLIGVTRTRGFPDNATGLINFFIASDTGGITGSVGDTGTDLGKVDDDCQRLATSLCVTLTTASAVVKTISVTASCQMWDDLDLTDTALRASATTNLTNHLKSPTTAPIGGIEVSGDPGKIFREALKAEITKAGLDKIFQLTLIDPAVDVPMANNDVPVFGVLTLSITRVPRQ